MTDARPVIRLNPRAGQRLRAGAPWVFSNEIAMQPEFRQLPRGGLVRVEASADAAMPSFKIHASGLNARVTEEVEKSIRGESQPG